MSCRGVTVNLKGQMVGLRELWRRSSAVGDKAEGKHKGGEVVRRWVVVSEWMCYGRLPGYHQIIGSLSSPIVMCYLDLGGFWIG